MFWYSFDRTNRTYPRNFYEKSIAVGERLVLNAKIIKNRETELVHILILMINYYRMLNDDVPQFNIDAITFSVSYVLLQS